MRDFAFRGFNSAAWALLCVIGACVSLFHGSYLKMAVCLFLFAFCLLRFRKRRNMSEKTWEADRGRADERDADIDGRASKLTMLFGAYVLIALEILVADERIKYALLAFGTACVVVYFAAKAYFEEHM